MSVTVRLPSQLRVLVGGAGEVVVEATTVREAIAAVEAQYPGLAARVLDEACPLGRRGQSPSKTFVSSTASTRR